MEGYTTKTTAAIAVNIFFIGIPFMGSGVRSPRSEFKVTESQIPFQAT